MRILSTLPWLALYLCAAFSLAIERGLLGAPRAPDLAALPARLGAFALGPEIELEPGALGKQPPERHAFRLVTDARGNEGRLFVAYYERAQRWSGRPHDVEKCFAALGWQEREVHRLEEAHRPWSRRFERDGRTIRVVHWLERPGPDEDRLELRQLGARLASGRGFRPDVASIYFEFEEGFAPDDAEAAAAVAALSRALEELW